MIISLDGSGGPVSTVAYKCTCHTGIKSRQSVPSGQPGGRGIGQGVICYIIHPVGSSFTATCG